MDNHLLTPPYNIILWKPITYPTVKRGMYLISTNGLIWSNYAQCYMQSFLINSGYLVVNLRLEEGGAKKFLIHRLVAYEFCNPPENFLSKEVNHLNGNKTINTNQNLEWVSKSDNMIHALETGLSSCHNETHYMSKLTNNQVIKICECLSIGMKYKDILKEIGLDPDIPNNHDLIGNIKRRIAWKNISQDYDFSAHDQAFKTRKFRKFND